MKNYSIRPIKEEEAILLENFLYQAIFQREDAELLPLDVIYQPEVNTYIKDFGKKDDYCLVAQFDGEIVGAVWTRILSQDIPGFGNIDTTTPEFAISVFSEYRGKGIGTDLMKAMLQVLKNCNYKQASLAVQKDNYATKMYQDVGFKIIKEIENEYIMVCKLS